MNVKVHIQMFGTADHYDAIVDREKFERDLEYCDVYNVSFFRITDLNKNKEAAVNPKYVAYIEFDEVKE